jgi:hypothetical protein
MTHAHLAEAEVFSPRATLDASAVWLPIDFAKLARFFEIALAIVVVSGVVREAIIAGIGTETVLKDLRHFKLDAERNLASWYESLCMAIAAGLLFLHAQIARQKSPADIVPWTILSVVFILMSMDEAIGFHEISVKPLRNALHLGGIFYYSWVLIAAPAVTLLGVYLLPFLLRLPRVTAMRFVACGAIFVGAALGTELVCGYFATHGGLETPYYKITAAAQEIFENMGMTLFVLSLLRHVGDAAPNLRTTFSG